MQDSKRDTDVLNSLLDSVGEGEGGMIWENGTETFKISYVKQTKKYQDIDHVGAAFCLCIGSWRATLNTGKTALSEVLIVFITLCSIENYFIIAC